MHPTSISAQPRARFTEDRLRNAAQKFAYIKAQQQLATVEVMCQMVDDFSQLATQQGLPDGAYEVFERAHLAIGYALLELQPKLIDLKPHGY